jgi:hypothetical protein
VLQWFVITAAFSTGVDKICIIPSTRTLKTKKENQPWTPLNEHYIKFYIYLRSHQGQHCDQ